VKTQGNQRSFDPSLTGYSQKRGHPGDRLSTGGCPQEEERKPCVLTRFQCLWIFARDRQRCFGAVTRIEPKQRGGTSQERRGGDGGQKGMGDNLH